MKNDTRGVTFEKDDFSEWFTELMIKSELADYSSVSGCIVFRPRSYWIWERVREEVDKGFKKIGIKNVYFPLFIPEKTFDKLKKHTEGFAPEVAWVTHGGNTKLNEKLAIRPTSETIMYESFSKWIRSWRDLPMLYNQWNNVVRWEFKHPVPFLRTREFLWNEGHTVYATKKEAESEEKKIIGVYDNFCRDFMALPSFIGKKSLKETFPGAEKTVSMEFYMPNGKAIQGPDWHHDGQHYSKAYGIKFLDKKGNEEYVWQNTFAISTRILGVMFAMHSDEKGLVLPPKLAENKVVIIPIFNEKNKEKVLKKTKEIEKKLKKYDVLVDAREEYRPGWKFNEWELKGIPLRVEIGEKDIAKKKVVFVRRDTLKKEEVGIADISEKAGKVLDDIQEALLKKAEKLLKDNITNVGNKKELLKAIGDKKIALVPLKSGVEVEDELKHITSGAKVLNIAEENVSNKKCVVTGDDADYIGRVGKSY
jgi:prolyl-tRNA synthetase